MQGVSSYRNDNTHTSRTMVWEQYLGLWMYVQCGGTVATATHNLYRQCQGKANTEGRRAINRRDAGNQPWNNPEGPAGKQPGSKGQRAHGQRRKRNVRHEEEQSDKWCEKKRRQEPINEQTPLVNKTTPEDKIQATTDISRKQKREI